MMTEKEMVNDALNNINSSLASYASAISQTENLDLRNTLIQMRNQAETSQYDLYCIAKRLNYYVPAHQASQEAIDQVKAAVSGCSCSSKESDSKPHAESRSYYISSQSNGILDHMDAQTKHALLSTSKVRK